MRLTKLLLIAASSLSTTAFALEQVSHTTSQESVGVNQRANSERCQSLTDKTIYIPFQQGEAGHVLVDSVFNQNVARAVVDTGGIGVGGVVSSDLYQKVKNDTQSMEESDVRGAMHSKKMQITSIESSGVKQATSKDLRYVISPNAVIPGEAEALLGAEFLCSFLVEFDFSKQQLILHPKDQSIESLLVSSDTNQQKIIWGKTDNQSAIMGAQVIDMTINNKSLKAVVDTGARHSIMNWKAAELIGLSKSSPEVVIEDNHAKGIHGNAPKKGYRVNLDKVGFAIESKVFNRDMTMRIADLGSFQPLVGDVPAINLGVDFLAGRRLLVDYQRRQVAMTE